MSTPVVLEVALNGVTTPERNPAVPREPAAIAEDALGCFEAGAAIVHTHTHQPVLPPDEAAGLYLEAYRPILDERPEAILYPTAGFGDSVEDRFGHQERLAEAGAIRVGLCDTGSVNLGASGPDGMPLPMDYVYTNTAADIRYAMEQCTRHALGPNIAIFEPGWLRPVLAAQRAGALPAGALVKLYFSAGGYLAGGEPMFSPPPIPEALEMYIAMLRDSAIPWAVAVLGGSLLDSPIARMALERGGHLRVGLEDHMDGEANCAQVKRARELCESHGRPLASIADTERILGLPSRST